MEFILREWKESDAADIAEFANNPKIAGNLRDGFPHPYTIDDAKAYIAGCKADTASITRAIEADWRAVGSIGIFPGHDVYRKSAELGYWLAEPYWSRGIMSRAIERLCAEAFSLLDIVRIFAEPFAGNAASRKALEKAGFRLEGELESSVYKNGKIQNSCIYALIKSE